MKRQNRILLLVFILCSLSAGAQTVLLNYDKALEKKYDKGPNQKKFTQGMMKFGFVLPSSDRQEIIAGNSVSWGIGLRKKFKVSPMYSLGWEFQMDFTSVKLKNTPGALSSYGTPIDVRRFDVSAISLGQFNRFNFDVNRGNFMGTFLDLGVTGKYCLLMSEVYKYDTGYGTARTEVDDLDYVKKLQAEVFARFGYSHISLWASYRFTDLFKSKFQMQEMPQVILGLEFGLY
ncbi:MAG: hypothetical protein ACO1G9_09045 [Bacteroidota bacterium]